MWFDAPESTYHTSSYLEVVFFIEFALCFITKVGPLPAFPVLDPPDPSA
jgi:hypothetical protein